MSVPTSLQAILQDVRYDHVYHYVLVATITVIVADFFQTLDDEIRFLWNSRVTLAKILYFANRYTPMFNVTFSIYMFILTRRRGDGICRNEFIAIGIIVFLQFEIANAVLCVRAYAVWKSARSRLVLIALLTSFIVSFSVQAYVVGLYISGSRGSTIGSSTGCTILLTNNKIWISMILLVVADSVALALLLAKSVTSFRSNSMRSSLLTVMVKDGLGYFACVTGLCLANLIVIHSAAPLLRDSFLLAQAAMQNVLCVRLLLHLHAVNRGSQSPISETFSTAFEMKDLRIVLPRSI